MLILSLLCRSCCSLGKWQCTPAEQKDGTGYWVRPRNSWLRDYGQNSVGRQTTARCRISKVPEHLQSPFCKCCGLNIWATFMSFREWSMMGKMEKFLASLSPFPFSWTWTWWSTFSGSVSTGQMNFWHLSWYPMPGKKINQYLIIPS